MEPQGPTYSPFLQTLHYLARPDAFARDCHARYGDVFALETIVFGPEVLVVRPEHIKMVFTGDPDELRAGEANIALEPMVGSRSVLLLDGAAHLRQRRLLLPPFHGERMREYAQTMREVTERVVDGWPIGRPFTLHPHFQDITLEVILRTVFGVEEGGELRDLHDDITALLALSSSPLALVGTTPRFRRDVFGLSPWAKFKRVRGCVDDRLFALIRRRRAEHARGEGGERKDILSLLLTARDEEGEGLSDAELRDELMTLLLAGHETTATELSWFFDKVLRNARVLAKVCEEGRGDAVASAPYIDATIKEVLRLAPVIPAVGRRLQRPMTIGGYEIPAGHLVVPAVTLTHRLPDVYPDPDALKPERFLDTKPDPYAWFPFGGGIRRCIGMSFALFEMRVVIATVLRKMRLRPTRPRPAPVTLRAFTHAPRGGVEVIAERLS